MFGIAQESYYELMTMNLPLMAVYPYSMKRHFHSSVLCNALHSVKGVLSLMLAILYVLVTIFSILAFPRVVLVFMKTPESSTAYTASGFFTNALKQLFQRCTAMPPAEPPVRMMRSAAFRLYLEWIQLKCDRVIAAPRKYSSASLYLTGSEAQPWCSEPSQYPKINLVQFANLLTLGSLERYPSARKISGHCLEDPRMVLLLQQQLCTVFAKVSSPHSPPPSKNIRKFLVSPPSCTQSNPGVPSRHLASGSKLWMTFWQQASAGAAVAMGSSKISEAARVRQSRTKCIFINNT